MLKFFAFITFIITKFVSGGEVDWYTKLYGKQVNSFKGLNDFRISTDADGGKGKHIFILFYYKWCHNCKDHQPFMTEAEK